MEENQVRIRRFFFFLRNYQMFLSYEKISKCLKLLYFSTKIIKIRWKWHLNFSIQICDASTLISENCAPILVKKSSRIVLNSAKIQVALHGVKENGSIVSPPVLATLVWKKLSILENIYYVARMPRWLQRLPKPNLRLSSSPPFCDWRANVRMEQGNALEFVHRWNWIQKFCISVQSRIWYR